MYYWVHCIFCFQKKQEFEQRQREGEIDTKVLDLAPKAKASKELEDKPGKQQKLKESKVCACTLLGVLFSYL
jgi:hypothetical protein